MKKHIAFITEAACFMLITGCGNSNAAEDEGGIMRKELQPTVSVESNAEADSQMASAESFVQDLETSSQDAELVDMGIHNYHIGIKFCCGYLAARFCSVFMRFNRFCNYL